MNLEDLLNLDDSKPIAILCKAWNRTVWMRAPSSGRKDAIDARLYNAESDETDMVNFRARMVALCLCDENGEWLSSDPVADGDRLAEKNTAAIRELFAQARSLLGDEGTEKN